MTDKKHDFFPIYINIHGKTALVVGGGKIAHRRVKTLSRFNINIKIVAQSINPELAIFSTEKGISVEEKPFQDRDILGADFVLLCIDDNIEAERITALCKEKCIPVNTSHKKELCDFYFPAIVEKGNLVIAIGANGENHNLVKKTREKLEELHIED